MPDEGKEPRVRALFERVYSLESAAETKTGSHDWVSTCDQMMLDEPACLTPKKDPIMLASALPTSDANILRLGGLVACTIHKDIRERLVLRKRIKQL